MQIFNEKQMATVGRVDIFYCGENSTAHLLLNDGFIGKATVFMSSTNDSSQCWQRGIYTIDNKALYRRTPEEIPVQDWKCTITKGSF